LFVLLGFITSNIKSEFYYLNDWSLLFSYAVLIVAGCFILGPDAHGQVS